MKIDKAFWESVIRGDILPKAAMAILVGEGYTDDDAYQAVFVSMGGSDIVELDRDGTERYPSGKTVREVEQAMER